VEVSACSAARQEKISVYADLLALFSSIAAQVREARAYPREQPPANPLVASKRRNEPTATRTTSEV
jgi:hypothetical protein